MANRNATKNLFDTSTSVIANSWILPNDWTNTIISPGSQIQSWGSLNKRNVDFNGLLEDYVVREQFAVEILPDSVVYSTDLPGVKRDTLDVSVFNGVLTVQCKRGNNVINRTRVLIDTIDVSEPTAKLEDGVLSVTFKLKSPKIPQKIEVK